MESETWHVAITLAEDALDVTAKARFADCAVDLVGLGVAPVGLAETPGLQVQALAVVRSLRSLAEALEEMARLDRLDPA